MFGIGYLWIQKTVLKALADIVNEKRNHVPAKIQDKKSICFGIIKIIVYFSMCLR